MFGVFGADTRSFAIEEAVVGSLGATFLSTSSTFRVPSAEFSTFAFVYSVVQLFCTSVVATRLTADVDHVSSGVSGAEFCSFATAHTVGHPCGANVVAALLAADFHHPIFNVSDAFIRIFLPSKAVTRSLDATVVATHLSFGLYGAELCSLATVHTIGRP